MANVVSFDAMDPDVMEVLREVRRFKVELAWWLQQLFHSCVLTVNCCGLQTFASHGVSIEAMAQTHTVDLALPRPLEKLPLVASSHPDDHTRSFPMDRVNVSEADLTSTRSAGGHALDDLVDTELGSPLQIHEHCTRPKKGLLQVSSGKLNARNGTHHLGEWRIERTQSLSNDRVVTFSEQKLSFDAFGNSRDAALNRNSRGNNNSSHPPQIGVDIAGCKASGDLHVLSQHPVELRTFYATAPDSEIDSFGESAEGSAPHAPTELPYETHRTISLHSFVGNMPHVTITAWDPCVSSSSSTPFGVDGGSSLETPSAVLLNTMQAGSLLLVSSRTLEAQVVESPAEWFGREIPRIPWIDFLRSGTAGQGIRRPKQNDMTSTTSAPSVHTATDLLLSHGLLYANHRNGNSILRMRLNVSAGTKPSSVDGSRSMFASRGETKHTYVPNSSFIC